MLRPLPPSTRAAAITPAEPVGARVARFPTAGSLPRYSGGSASALPVSRPAQRSTSLRPAWWLNRPGRPFVIGVLQPMSLPPSSAPTATGWSDGVDASPGRHRNVPRWMCRDTTHLKEEASSGTRYHHRDRLGEAQFSAPWRTGRRVGCVPQEAEPEQGAGFRGVAAALCRGDGGLREFTPLGPRDRKARSGRIPDFPVTRSHPPASWPSAANSSICRTYRKTAGEESRRRSPVANRWMRP